MKMVKRMRARYSSQCACGTRIRIGDSIGYSRDGGRGQVMCSVCFSRWQETVSPSRHDGGAPRRLALKRLNRPLPREDAKCVPL